MSDRSAALRATQVGFVVMGMHELLKARSVGMVCVGVGLVLCALHIQLFFKFWESRFTELDGEPDAPKPEKSSIREIALRVIAGGLVLVGLVIHVVSSGPSQS